jgi:hypothetical protein
MGAWVWPGIGLGILAAGMALFVPRALDRHDGYDPGYAAVALSSPWRRRWRRQGCSSRSAAGDPATRPTTR